MKEIVLENDTIKVQMTGRTFVNIAVVENKTNYPIQIHFTDDFYPCEDFEIPANDWVGVLANEEGAYMLNAFREGLFEIKGLLEGQVMI